MNVAEETPRSRPLPLRPPASAIPPSPDAPANWPPAPDPDPPLPADLVAMLMPADDPRYDEERAIDRDGWSRKLGRLTDLLARRYAYEGDAAAVRLGKPLGLDRFGRTGVPRTTWEGVLRAAQDARCLHRLLLAAARERHDPDLLAAIRAL